MSGLADLKQILLETAMDCVGAASPVAYETTQAGVALLLLQIDRQVVPSKIEFTFEDGTRVGCIAASRRIVRFVKPAPRDLAAEYDESFEKQVFGPEDEQIVTDILTRCCEQGRDVSIRTLPQSDPQEVTANGILARSLGKPLGIKFLEQIEKRADPIASFIGSHRAALQSGVVFRGDEQSVVCNSGIDDTKLIEWASGVLEPFVTPAFPLLGAFETSGIIILGSSNGTRRHKLLVGHRGDFLVADLRESNLDVIVRDWRAS